MHVPARGALAALVSLIIASPAAAVTLGQIDDFEDGTTQGWTVAAGPMGATHPAPPANIASGGPQGAGDAFLLLTSVGGPGSSVIPGSRMTAMNLSQWSGDYLAAGVGQVGLWARNFGSTDLSLRLLVENPTGGPPTDVAFSSDPVVLLAGGVWRKIRFSLDPDDLTAQLGTTSGALSSATVLRLYHATDGGFPGPPVFAQLGVDDIEALAVPEPSAWTLLIGGFGIAGAALRRRRTGQQARAC